MKNFLLLLVMIIFVAALIPWWSPELRKEAARLLRDNDLMPQSVTLYKWISRVFCITRRIGRRQVYPLKKSRHGPMSMYYRCPVN